MSRAICILGMHRSGTSTVSRAINLLGAYLGENNELMPPLPDNPEGFWERLDIYDIHERLLSLIKQRWDTVLPLPRGWQKSPEIEPFRQELRTIISKSFKGRGLWGWKDPRTCILMDMWKELLEEAGVALSVVFVVRHPIDVANSLHKRDGFTLDKSYGIWFNYNLTALSSVQGVPTAYISYDRFLDNGIEELRRCAQILNISWPADDKKLNMAIGTFLRKDLRHSKSDSDMLTNLPNPIKTLNAILSTAVARGSLEAMPQQLDDLLRDASDYAGFFRADVEGYFEGCRALEAEKAVKEAMEAQLHAAQQYINKLEMERDDVHQKIEAMLDSKSWKITKPLRHALELISGVRSKI
jgi:hypothetical protein